MANERADIAMTPDEVRAFLGEGRTLVLVTLGPDGFPDPVPMWFVVDEAGTVWMRTYAASQKVVNLRRDPRCAVLVEAGDLYVELRGVQVTGRVELVEDLDVICGVFADLMIKYEGVDPAHRDGVMAGYRAKAAKQVALRLVPERVVSWDHRKQAAVRAAAAG